MSLYACINVSGTAAALPEKELISLAHLGWNKHPSRQRAHFSKTKTN
jgi:hypothetical protein